MHKRKFLYWLILPLLIGLGFVGNVFKVTLFYNVDLLFGSLFVMLVISLYGPVWGGIAGVIASSYTYVLWNHPYAIIIFTCEALFVGIIFSRRKDNLVYIDIIYWFIIGMPLVYLFYHVLMGMDNVGSVLIMLKQAVNGILNALLARILLMFFGKRSVRIFMPFWKGRWRFTNLLSNTIIGFVLLPVLSFTAISGWLELREIDRDISVLLTEDVYSAAHLVDSWLLESEKDARAIASIVEEKLNENAERENIEDALNQILAGNPRLQEVFLLDAKDSVALYSGEKKQSEVKAPDVLPPVGNGDIRFSIERDTGDNTFVLIQKTIYNVRKQGYEIMVLKESFSQLQSYIRNFSKGHKTAILITDNKGNIITGGEETTEKFYDFIEDVRENTDSIVRWVPESKKNTSVMERWKEAIHILSTQLTVAEGWKLYSYASVAPYQERVYASSLNKLLILVALIFITAILSRIIAGRYVLPLKALQKITTDLPENLIKQHRPQWPKSMAVEISGLISNFKNMTFSLKKAFLELHEEKNKAEVANRAKSRFLANMSHDIRTPITAIQGMVEIILDTETLDEETKRDIETIGASSKVLLRILNNILDLSKLEAGKLKIERTNVDIEKMIDQLLRLFQGSLNIKNIEFSVSIGPEVPPIMYTDPLRLQQILMNLIGNAVKFTEEGEIRLEVRKEHALPFSATKEVCADCLPITFYIRDTGIGISEDKQELIFESFSQADTSTTRQFGGSGLGLTISKELVEALGGTISVESSPGEGSVFFFTLPIKEVNEEKETTSLDRDGESQKKSEGTFTFLIADDDLLNRKIAERVLVTLGHEVINASNGNQVLEILEKQQIDCIFMDISMPILNGLETAKKIRQREEEAPVAQTTIPIIALSAGKKRETAESWKEAGMDDYLEKPITADAVERVIKEFIISEIS